MVAQYGLRSVEEWREVLEFPMGSIPTTDISAGMVVTSEEVMILERHVYWFHQPMEAWFDSTSCHC